MNTHLYTKPGDEGKVLLLWFNGGLQPVTLRYIPPPTVPEYVFRLLHSLFYS